jgi:chitinase
MFVKYFLLILLFPVLCLTAAARPPAGDFKIVGYYSLSEAMNKPQKRIIRQLTHINLWFLNPDSLGNFTRDLSALKPFVDAAHKKNVKVLFSIGGGSKQPQYHWLLKDDQRAVLVRNLVAEMLKYGLDGVDVDLEGGDIDENYEKFIVELSAALKPQGKLLTAAIAVYYKDQFTDLALSKFDFVNIMVYDRTGPWRPDKPGPHSLYEHAVEDLTYFGEERRISKERMVLGVPFYGHAFGKPGERASSMNFKEIVAEYPGSEQADEWKLSDGRTIYYNGIPTMKNKTRLAKEKASGIMIWQVLGDAPGKNSLLKAINKAVE